MASVSFTYGGNYDPNNISTLDFDPIIFVPARSDSLSLGVDPSIGMFRIMQPADHLFSHGFVLSDISRGTLLAGDSYSVFADFSDNTAAVYLGGGDWGDLLRGGSAADTIGGGGGDDVIEGGANGDTLTGGDGVDTLSYEHSLGRIIIDLSVKSASGGDADGDIISGFENLRGGTGHDSLTGDANNNALEGGAGNDVLEGGAGADVLNGGAGTDTASYKHAAGSVEVYLDPAIWFQMSGDAAGDTFSSIENVRGSAYADAIWGDRGNNLIEGGAGGDHLVGGGGIDTVSYASSSAGVTVSFLSFSGSGGDASGDLVLGFANLRGSRHDDSLTGDEANNALIGGGSDGPLGDSLYGMGGDDRLVVSDAPAMVDGGAGTDKLSVAAGSSVTFAAGSIVDVERVVVLAGATADFSALAQTPASLTIAAYGGTVIGTDVVDRIYLIGGGKATGGGGADVMVCGSGSDTFVFDNGFGRDRIDRLDVASDHLDLSALGLTLDDLTFQASANGVDTRISIAGNTDDWITLKGVHLDKASLPDGFLIL